MKRATVFGSSVILFLLGIAIIALGLPSNVFLAVTTGMVLISISILIWLVPIHFAESKGPIELKVIGVEKRRIPKKRTKKMTKKKRKRRKRR